MKDHFEIKRAIRGAKGGGGGSQPPAMLEPPNPDTTEDVITSNSVFQCIDVICEGPIESFVDSSGANTNDVAQSIYLDETPIKNISESFNFQNISYETKKGFSNQDAMSSMDRPSMEYVINKPLYGKHYYNDFSDRNTMTAKWANGSVDIQRAGVPDKNYSKWYDESVKNIPQNEMPITHIIKNKECASFSVTILINQLMDTCARDDMDKTLRAFGDPRLGGNYKGFEKKYKAGENYATLVEFRIEYGRVMNDGTEEVHRNLRYYIYGYCTSASYIDFGRIKDSNVVSGRVSSKVYGGSNMGLFVFPSEWNDEKTLYKFVRVRRTSPETYSSLIRRSISFYKVTEYSPVFMTYPLCAVSAIKSDARTFAQIPKRSFKVRMSKVFTPNNYQPMVDVSRYVNGEMRTIRVDRRRYEKAVDKPIDSTLIVYSGDWDYLTLKKQWTDNPVWIILDILTSTRYGLGSYVKMENVDMFSFYDIARYCDGVDEEGRFIGYPDGFGGLEPRFSFSTVIRERINVIDCVTSILNLIDASLYWNNGKVSLSHKEEKRKVRALFNNRNVVDGIFNYTSIRRDERFNVVEVNYTDEKDLYKNKIEYCTNEADLVENGISKTSISAWGCCSKGMAQRVGNRFLSQNSLSINKVSFMTGYEALFLQLNDIFLIDDDLINLTENYGRISSINDSNPETFSGIIEIIIDKALDSSRVVIGGKIKFYIYWNDPKEKMGETGELAFDNLCAFSTDDFEIREKETVLRIMKNDISENPLVQSAEGFHLGSVVSVEVLDKSTRRYRTTSIREDREGVFEVSGDYLSDEEFRSLAITEHYRKIAQSFQIPILTNSLKEVSLYASEAPKTPQDMADDKYDQLMGILKAPDRIDVTSRTTSESGFLNAMWTPVSGAYGYLLVVKNSIGQEVVNTVLINKLSHEFKAVIEDRYNFYIWTLNSDSKTSRYPETTVFFFTDSDMINRSPSIYTLEVKNEEEK